MNKNIVLLISVAFGMGNICSEYDVVAKDDIVEPPDNDTGVDCPPSIPDCHDTEEPEDTDPPIDTSPQATCDDYYLEASSLSLNEDCNIEVQTGTFTPVVEWTKDTWSVEPSSNNIMMTPIVASLTDDNGDGNIDENDTPDIIVITYGGAGTLRAVSGDGSGTEIFNVVGQGLQGQGALAAGDIDNDGIVEIIAPTSNGVKAFEHDGTLKWTNTSMGGHIVGTSDAPAIADMDGDGNPEIIMGRAIVSNTGAFLGAGSYGIGSTTNVGTTSFAADIDGDGQQEVVVGNALYDINGGAIWSNGEADGYVGVADFDGDGVGDIVVSGDGRVRVQDGRNGNVIWRATISSGGSSYGGSPTIADYDGDGEPEVGVAGQSTYSVYDTNGTLMWERATQDASSGNTGSAVFDFEGDGIAEAVYADETRLWVFNGPDGLVKLESTEHSNNTWTEYPVIADVDADGVAEIVVANTNGHRGFYVFGDADGSWREGRRVWNQHAYNITNVNDDGSIPRNPVQNWTSYNNFRSGDLTAGTGGSFPDLVVSIDNVCDTFCEDGRLFVHVRVGNQGFADVEPPIALSLYAITPDGDRIMANQTVTQALASGERSETITFEVAGMQGWDIQDIRLLVDGGNEATDNGDHFECDETNNEVTWGSRPCLD